MWVPLKKTYLELRTQLRKRESSINGQLRNRIKEEVFDLISQYLDIDARRQTLHLRFCG